jgi:CRISPR-associated endonuclease Csn1
MASQGYRFGLDIGTNSIGWCVLALDEDHNPAIVVDLGSRIFSDGRNPKDKTSLAVNRRMARQMRRRRDRYLYRRDRLMRLLIRFGLMPPLEADRKVLEQLDPYDIRVRGLHSPLSPWELGRALFHLNQRRGFKSSRIPGKPEKDKDAGLIKTAVSRTSTLMAGRTLGQTLVEDFRAHGHAMRTRLEGTGKTAAYTIYPARAMIEDEFNRLWAAQMAFHPGLLTDNGRMLVHARIFDQRKLKEVKPGYCLMEPDKHRAPRALPIFQRFRILKEAANLRLRSPGNPSQALTLQQFTKLTNLLLSKGFVKFDEMRKVLKLSADITFNLESEKREGLDGDKTAERMAHKKSGFGPAWFDFTRDQQFQIIDLLLNETDEDALIQKLMALTGIDETHAELLANTALPDGHSSFCEDALIKIVAAMEAEPGLQEDQAIMKVYGRSHSHFPVGTLLDQLPYYGRVLRAAIVPGTGNPQDSEEKKIGRIANPTVHIGLNQLRRVVNDLIAEFGRPHDIIVELARDLKRNKKQRQADENAQAANQKRNGRYREMLAPYGLEPRGDLMTKLKLWEAQSETCIYTGLHIGLGQLLSDEIEIDHIIPFSISLDDSLANRVVCVRDANRIKRGRTPYDAFHSSTHPGYNWDDILARAQFLPSASRWRFEPDALDRLKGQESDFIARQLTDTQYLSRLARQYLEHICPVEKISVTPGRLTSMLRGKWGLNDLVGQSHHKDRIDHRHHALDAFVISLTDRWTLQHVATGSARFERGETNRLLEDFPEPFPGFERDDLAALLDQMVVSHRPEHGAAGALHEDTAYGLVRDPTTEDGHNLVFRKALVDLTGPELDRIRDKGLRRRIKDAVDDALSQGEKLQTALARFADVHNIRRLRLLKKDATVRVIRNGAGQPYKAIIPGENLFIDIWSWPKGEQWVGCAVSRFDAATRQPIPRPHPAAKRVMRLYKGDLIELDHEGGRQIMRVVRLEIAAGRVRLAGHREAGKLEDRHNDRDDPFRWLFMPIDHLRRRNARKIHVRPAGKLMGVPA